MKKGKPDKKKPQEPDKKSKGAPLIKKYVLSVILFFALLWLITTFSNPGLFINDEWITANQLYQLNSGHQVVFNEGPYGTYGAGELTPYFIAHGNVLQYTLILPLISLPVLRLFGLFGDNFRFLVLLIWSFIPMAIALLVGTYYPQYGKIKGVRWIWPAIVFSFILLFANMLWYYPFPFIAADAPGEVAALVFTDHVLFALTGVVIFQAALTLHSSDTWKGLFAMVLILANSSFLFWAGNAKDHMLVAFLFALVILFFIRYFKDRQYIDAGIGFIAIGLLTWARPEVGFFVFLFTAAFFLIMCYLYSRKEKRVLHSFIIKASALLLIFPGIIPFLVNNFLVTGDPFLPTFFVRLTLEPAVSVVNATIGNGSSAAIAGVAQNPVSLERSVNVLFSYFIFSPGDVLRALPQVFFWPASGNMSVLAVCPLAIFALITVILLAKKKISPGTVPIIIYCVLMTVAIFVAYMKAMTIINGDAGIIPDMRYLSPAYIPLGLLGTVSVFSLLNRDPVKDLLKNYLIIAVILVPVIILSLIIFHPFGRLYPGFTLFFMILSSGLIIVTLLFWLGYLKRVVPYKYLAFVVLVLLAIPLCWQMMMVFLYSAAKINGYPFWIPLVEQFFNTFVHVSKVG